MINIDFQRSKMAKFFYYLIFRENIQRLQFFAGKYKLVNRLPKKLAEIRDQTDNQYLPGSQEKFGGLQLLLARVPREDIQTCNSKPSAPVTKRSPKHDALFFYGTLKRLRSSLYSNRIFLNICGAALKLFMNHKHEIKNCFCCPSFYVSMRAGKILF